MDSELDLSNRVYITLLKLHRVHAPIALPWKHQTDEVNLWVETIRLQRKYKSSQNFCKHFIN
jgi:hypothetical protein